MTYPGSNHDDFPEWREHAALYALNVLDQAEAAAFEAHLETCEECRAEVQASSEIVGGLAYGAPLETPPPRIREELLRRVAPEAVLVRAAEGAWTQTPFEGVEVRQLFADPVSGEVTSQVRMQPGAQYPPHRHAGNEHCYVLEGDLVFSDHTLYAGDYEINFANTDHSPVTTTGGCLLLIVNSIHDQILPA